MRGRCRYLVVIHPCAGVWCYDVFYRPGLLCRRPGVEGMDREYEVKCRYVERYEAEGWRYLWSGDLLLPPREVEEKMIGLGMARQKENGTIDVLYEDIRNDPSKRMLGLSLLREYLENRFEGKAEIVVV